MIPPGWLTRVRCGRFASTWIIVYNGLPGTARRLVCSEEEVRSFCRLAGVEMVATEPGHALSGTADSYRPAQMPGMQERVWV